jgi:signal transduction histidine kinase
MRFSVSKISLRTRLLLMTAFAFLALIIAVLSAYRTAQTSAYYAERQAASSVGAVAREFSRGARDAEVFDRDRKMPPHVREAFEKYADENTRRTAIALGVEREVSAGFCGEKGEIFGAIYNQNFSRDETAYLENSCKNLSDNNLRRSDFNDSSLFIETVKFDDAENNTIGAFAARSVGKSSIFADRFNFLTQGFLLLSAVGLAIFSFLTLREWRGGMRKIETGLQKIPNDLSERIDEPKIAELALLSREINRLAENLETNLARQNELEKNLAQTEKLAALGRVASGVAHEIRNPLAAMKLKIQMAARNDFDKSKLEKTFAVLNEEIARLDRLISKMLDAGKQKKLNFSLIAPDQILRERLLFIKEKADAQNVKIENRLSAKDEKINADAEKLTQVFDNLLLNALEAMPNGGTLKVGSINDADKIIYEFSDSGAGISATEKEKIFEPFFTTKDKGTGLGLAISREIIEAHNGKLFLADAETGAKFVVELPSVSRIDDSKN